MPDNQEHQTGDGALQSVELPADAIVLVPLRDAVVFPGSVAPVNVGRSAGVQALEYAMLHDLPMGLITQRNAEVDVPGAADLYGVGTVADVMRLVVGDEEERHVLFRGKQRFRLTDVIQTKPFLAARGCILPECTPEGTEWEARVLVLRQQALKAVELLPRPMPDLRMLLEGVQDPAQLTDLIAALLDLPVATKQALLETTDLFERVQKVSAELSHQIEVLELTHRIGQETRGSMDRDQREYFLREQLRAIQRELGEPEDKGTEVRMLREQLQQAHMPPEVEKRAFKELARLDRIPEMAAEYGVIRTYLDLLVDLPWSVSSETEIDIGRARTILDEDHHDLLKVKKRILEFLAVRKLNPAGKSPILCFVGPPGVGKTSLGQSIAKATGRRFVRQSLGGVHDESEIRGHRRTYVGAMPGRIIQCIRRVGTNNPVFMLDEVDKLASGIQGDPAAALLEVLDPEQNHAFEDHYVDAPFDLSRVMFIATANVLDNIPGPLRDRMEVIELPGYSEEDKVHIARRYLVPRERSAAGLLEGALDFQEDAIREIAGSYTREAGVRQLSREIGAVCRAVAMLQAEGKPTPSRLEAASVATYLGQRRFINEVAMRTSLPGVATGLAWTAVGGQILFVEATRMAGEGRLILTGQLGDVMKESAQAALSLVKSRARLLNIDAQSLRKNDIHIHIPAGAIPKDGPSAGVAIFVALASLLLDRRVGHRVAMTGEISLRGLVLPVGGIKEKVLAARRAGITHVLLPELSMKDLEDIPEEVRHAMQFHAVQNVDQALALALEPAALGNTQQSSSHLVSSGTDPVSTSTHP